MAKKQIKIEIEFGSYYGISVPQLILADINMRLYKSGILLLNNELDSHRLSSLGLEFNIFKYAMNNIIIRDYSEPGMKRLSRRVKKSQEYYDKVNSIEHLGENIKEPAGLFSEEELELQKEVLSKCDKTIQNYVIINGETKQLSDEAVKIIEFLDSYLILADTLKENIQVRSFTESEFMGLPVSTYLRNKPGSIKYRYLDGVYKQGNQDKMRNRAIREIDIFMRLVTSKVNDKEYTKIDIVNGKVSNMDYKISDENIPVLEALKENNILRRLTDKEVNTLIRLYELSKLFTVSFYNDMFELNLTKEEYEKVFKELEDIGIIGFGFYSDKLFLDCLKKYTILEYTRTVINEEDELAKNIKLVYRACHSKLEFGGDLDEGYFSNI